MQNSVKFWLNLLSLLITDYYDSQLGVINEVSRMVKKSIKNFKNKSSTALKNLLPDHTYRFDRLFSNALGGNVEVGAVWDLVGQKYRRYSAWRFISLLASVLTAPIIYSIYIPLTLLDLMASIYQTVCFPIYGIEKVNRSDYVVIDRHKLSYLTWLEKLNCVYCGYGNGVLAYVSEIASRTESYWCPIKHEQKVQGPHQRYDSFCEYGDEPAYDRKLKKDSEYWRV